jgi:hypothetical protein
METIVQQRDEKISICTRDNGSHKQRHYSHRRIYEMMSSLGYSWTSQTQPGVRQKIWPA